MKKAMFILSTVLLFGILASCGTDELTVKKNWTFTVTTVTTITPDDSEMGPQTQVTTVEKENLTEVEAEAAAKTLEVEGTMTTTLGGITMSMKTTVTKAEKK